MKRFGFLLSALLLLQISACSSDPNHKVTGGELTVYFLDVEDEAVATKVALYWKEHDLLTGKPQDLQLSKSENVYTLAMIAEQPDQLDMMSFAEKRLLNKLKKDLWREVFDEKYFNLVLTNSKFEPLYSIGQ